MNTVADRLRTIHRELKFGGPLEREMGRQALGMAQEVERAAEAIRLPRTMHACSVCGMGHSTREEGFYRKHADWLAEDAPRRDA